jgi:hypothetical protein
MKVRVWNKVRMCVIVEDEAVVDDDGKLEVVVEVGCSGGKYVK